MQANILRPMAILFAVTALLIFLIDFRLGQQGKWFPKDLPVEVNGWYAADMPLSQYDQMVLGNPPTLGRRYSNLFNERVDAQVIATESFDSYTEPVAIWAGYGYALTADKKVDLFGKAGQIREMILQSVRDGNRVLLYYWIQYEDGTVATLDNVRKFRDLGLRAAIGFGALVGGKQSCIVRVFTPLHPADPMGLQARRNMDEISKALYDSMKKQGNSGSAEPVGVMDVNSAKSAIGPDIAYLNEPSASESNEKRTNLLPLTVNNSWSMNSNCQGEKSHDKIVVSGPHEEAGVSGTQLTIYREGKPWRREILRKDGDTMYVVGLQDETSPLMTLKPPLPLWKEPVKEGATEQWIGEYTLVNGSRMDGSTTGLKKTETWPARAFSRISGMDTLPTPAGKFKTFRIDTIIVVNRNGTEIRFPMVRWMAPGVGYVRRGFADKGRPAFSELARFDVQ